MEATKKAEVRLESVNIKRKKFTGHAFKSRFKRLKKTLTDGSGLENSIDLLSRVNSDDSERLSATSLVSKTKGALEPERSPCLGEIQDGVLNSECTESYSHPKKTLLAEGETDLLVTCITCSKKKGPSAVLQEKQFCSCNSTVDMEVDGSSASKKFMSNDESAESEGNISVKIRRKCEKRMKKLILRQQQETQRFHQGREEAKRSLEKDHKLEAAIIRYIYSEGSLRTEKLRKLDGAFGKKMEESNLLKEAQLQDLEARQQAARNLEKHLAACWLTEARSNCYGEQAAASGELPLPSESDKDVSAEVPEVVDHDDAEDLRNSCPDRLMDVDQSVETDEIRTAGSPVAAKILEPPEKVSPNHCDSLPQPVPDGQIHAVFVSKDAEDRDAPVPESSLQTIAVNSEPDDIVAPVHSCVEKHTSENCEHDADNHEDVDAPVPEGSNLAIEVLDSEVVPHVEEQTIENCELLHPVSIEASRSANLSSDTDVKHQGHDSEKTLIQTSQESSQAEGILGRQNNHINIASVPEEQIPDADRQDGDAIIQEDHGTVQIEAPSSELVGVVASQADAQPVKSCEQLHSVSTSELVGIVASHSEAQPVENCEQQHSVIADVSPSCDPSLATEVEQQICNSVRNSTEIAEAVEDLSHMEESACQVELDFERNRNCPDADMLSSVSHDSSAEFTTTFPTNMQMFQAVANTDARNAHGSFSLFLHPNGPISFANPFETELVKIIQEGQRLDQSYKDMISNLKSECEKEIQAIIAQIRSKYEARLKVTEADYKLKKSELHKNQNKVLVNKVLAQAFSSTYTPGPSGVPGIPQDTRSGSIQQPRQQSSQLPPGSSACQPPSNHYVSAPNLRAPQQPLTLHSTNQIIGRNTTAAPVQVPYHPAVISRPSTSWPPVIHNFNPAVSHHVAGQIIPDRGLVLAPHLQAGAATLPMSSRPPHMAPHQPRLPWLASLPYQNHNRPTEPLPPPPPPPPPLPDISTTFGTLDSSYFETLSNIHAGNSNNATASEVLLIDDD